MGQIVLRSTVWYVSNIQDNFYRIAMSRNIINSKLILLSPSLPKVCFSILQYNWQSQRLYDKTERKKIYLRACFFFLRWIMRQYSSNTGCKKAHKSHLCLRDLHALCPISAPNPDVWFLRVLLWLGPMLCGSLKRGRKKWFCSPEHNRCLNLTQQMGCLTFSNGTAGGDNATPSPLRAQNEPIRCTLTNW